MRKTLYSIRDNLTFDYDNPIVYSSDLDCLRSVTTQIASDKLRFEKGQIDFDPSPQHATRSIYSIGYFYPESGVVEEFEPKLLCVVSDAPNLFQKLMVEFRSDNSI